MECSYKNTERSEVFLSLRIGTPRYSFYDKMSIKYDTKVNGHQILGSIGLETSPYDRL